MYQNCGLCLAEKEGFSQTTLRVLLPPTRKYGRIGRSQAPIRFFLFSPLGRSLPPPPAAVASQAPAGKPALGFESARYQQKQKTVLSDRLLFLGNNCNLDTKSIEIKRAIPLQMYAIEYADPQFFLAWIGMKCDFWIGMKGYLPTI